MRGHRSAGARCTLFDVNAMLTSTPWRAAARIGPLSRGGGSPPSLRACQVSLPVVNLNVVVALALRVLPFGGAVHSLGGYPSPPPRPLHPLRPPLRPRAPRASWSCP